MNKGIVIYGRFGKASDYLGFQQLSLGAKKVKSLENIDSERIYFGPKVKLEEIKNYIEKLKLEKKEEPFMSLIVYDKDLERMAFAKENEWVNVKEFQIMKYSIYNSKKTQDYFNEINREAMENCEKNLEELKK